MSRTKWTPASLLADALTFPLPPDFVVSTAPRKLAFDLTINPPESSTPSRKCLECGEALGLWQEMEGWTRHAGCAADRSLGVKDP